MLGAYAWCQQKEKKYRQKLAGKHAGLGAFCPQINFGKWIHVRFYVRVFFFAIFANGNNSRDWTTLSFKNRIYSKMKKFTPKGANSYPVIVENEGKKENYGVVSPKSVPRTLNQQK